MLRGTSPCSVPLAIISEESGSSFVDVFKHHDQISQKNAHVFLCVHARRLSVSTVKTSLCSCTDPPVSVDSETLTESHRLLGVCSESWEELIIGFG